ncbi:hypothetical protein G7Y89_g3260 [Cudoniella acicularis]|uniref:DUF7732 domain-containing protein n=1 Tax=Cudoniella acicularis TaxID=354080 RepID=A0A8H4RRR2_9HELO|nr:hypothetical protein G7Y89_g3260 [Cudoniella acicularis]
MKLTLSNSLAALLLVFGVLVLSLPQPISGDIQLLSRDEAEARDFPDRSELWKRKGGGGGGGKGGGGSSSSGSSSSSSAGKGGSSSSSSSSSSGSSASRGSSSSSVGGQTRTGSGVTPNYGGGRYYGGGATVPYSAGARSPLGIPAVFLGASLLAFYPGLWLYGAYSYPYTHPYTFHNRTARANATATTTSTSATATPTATNAARSLRLDCRQSDTEGVNQTKPVTCLCAVYAECGCDDSGNSTFLDSLIGDGTYANLNHTLVTVADVNGTSTIIINGTLPNGTTASGGTEDAYSAATRSIVNSSGYWVMIALVLSTVFLTQ